LAFTKLLKSKWILLLPYIIGVLWTICHPIVSVITGESKCRGAYIDEIQFDSFGYDTEPYPKKKNAISLNENDADDDMKEMNKRSLCHVLYSTHLTHSDTNLPSSSKLKNYPIGKYLSSTSFSCFMNDSFDIVKVTPVHNTPVESLVFVIPPSKNWIESEIHVLVLNLLDRLARAPWLSKTIFIISPNYHMWQHADRNATGKGNRNLHTTNQMLQETLDNFLEASNPTFRPNFSYIDNRNENGDRLLPSSFTSSLIRQIIVLDILGSIDSSNHFTILPQGRKGLLPNLDLFFHVVNSFHYLGTIPMKIHPYDMGWWKDTVLDGIGIKDDWWRTWGVEIGEIGGFMANSALGPYAPHASALERGIDSLTIIAQLNLTGKSIDSIHPQLSNFFQGVEHTIRAMSNLQERLHHSISQYLLPSTTKFVSNGEYMIPAILVMLPLAIRALLLILRDIETINFNLVFKILGMSSVLSFYLICVSFIAIDARMTNTLVIASYFTTFIIVRMEKKKGNRKAEDESLVMERKVLQLIACLLALYLHVPLVIGHFSLGYPSTIFWTPLLAFCSHGNVRHKIIQKLFAILFLTLTWPPLLLVQKLFGGIYTIYVCTVFAPLHFILSILWLY